MYGIYLSGRQIYGWPRSLSHDFKIWPITFKAVSPVDPSILVVKKSHLNKKIPSDSRSTNSTKQKVHVGSQNSKTCLKQPLKNDKTKILIANGNLMKVKRIAECSQYF